MDATRSPGWYPAPDGNGQQWWNGAGWSESRQGAAVVGAPKVSPAPVRAPTAPVAPVAPAGERVVYSASNPAPQYPGQLPTTLNARIPAAMRIDARANPSAVYALIAGIGAVVFNVLLVPSILAIVFAVRAFKRAKELAAAGEQNTMRSLAVIGLSLGIFGGAIGLIQAFVFAFSIIASIFSAIAGTTVS